MHGIPDYANMETTNRIISNGSWTVDRDGWVYLHSDSNTDENPVLQFTYFYINDKEIGQYFINIYGVSVSSGGIGCIFPVKTGDVVRIQAKAPSSNIGCHFIPLLFNTGSVSALNCVSY